MNKVFTSLFAVALVACPPVQSQVAESRPLPAGTTIPAMLDKWVDVRKNKVGDEVVAQTTAPVKVDGLVIIPKGSKILGHVTVVKSRTSDDPNSVLGIAFESVVLKKSGELPLRLTIQAVAPDRSTNQPIVQMKGTTRVDTTGEMEPLNRPGTMGANADPNAGMPGRPESPANSAYDESGGRTPNGTLTPQCHGVLGIEGLSLAIRPNDATKAPLIISQTRNVRLDGRTQLLFRITAK